MKKESTIREEELKNRVATAYFGKYDCDRIIGNIDFCVLPKRRDPRQMTFIPDVPILWAEAKNHPTGILADVFRFRFSTKYYDSETGLYYYGYRFYSPPLMRWLNRDPIEEDGGVNLYSLINNNPISGIDYLGLAIIVIKHLPGTTPPSGWPDTDDAKCLALTVYKSPTYSVSETKYPGGKIGFKVDVNPPNSFVDVYFRTPDDFLTKMQYEKDHISVARRHEQAIQDFKRNVEAICDCPKPAREARDKEELSLIRKVQALRTENAAYDAPGGPHVLRQ